MPRTCSITCQSWFLSACCDMIAELKGSQAERRCVPRAGGAKTKRVAAAGLCSATELEWERSTGCRLPWSSFNEPDADDPAGTRWRRCHARPSQPHVQHRSRWFTALRREETKERPNEMGVQRERMGKEGERAKDR